MGSEVEQADDRSQESVAKARPTQPAATDGHISLRPSLVHMSQGVSKRRSANQEGAVTFTEQEVEFLAQSKLARVATATREGQPHVVPVVYEFDGRAFYFTGWNLEKTLKYRNIEENSKVALVIDELVTVCPWRPRGLEVRGTAELGSEGGRAYVKVTPIAKRSWGFR